MAVYGDHRSVHQDASETAEISGGTELLPGKSGCEDRRADIPLGDARRLVHAGIPLELHVVPGTLNGFVPARAR